MLSALGLARAIEDGELTPAQAVELCADAIAKRESDVGAFVTLDIETARKAAQTPGLKDRPLLGVPVALKDIFDTADMPTEYGRHLPGHRPKVDASLVALIRRNGGTLPARPSPPSSPIRSGQDAIRINRAHAGRLVVGVGGGVAAGFFPIATGTQTGGSVIRPAALRRRRLRRRTAVADVGMKCVSWHLDTAGLFAASVSDVAFAAAVMSDRDLRVDGRKPSSPRIGVLRDQPWAPASDDMKAALDNVARAASAANARVRDIKLAPVLASAFRAHATIHAYECARSLASEYERFKDKLRQRRAGTGRERFCDQRRRLRRRPPHSSQGAPRAVGSDGRRRCDPVAVGSGAPRRRASARPAHRPSTGSGP